MRKPCVTFVLLACLAAQGVRGAPIDAAGLIRSLAREPPATIAFAEARFSPLL
jgi:hypothetical protein